MASHKSLARAAAGILAVLALAALTFVALISIAPPAARSADAPPNEFSAGRAYAHVEAIGAKVHVAGSPAADDVRTYIEQTLRGFGLQPEIQDAVGATNALGGSFAMARVRNVVAVLKGTHSTGPVFLMAHYDSVQVSYGGNDDGAGVSTLLETARVLVQGPQPRNDIVFVFTDAEEACLCGAEAFVSQDPLAAAGGVVLNLEARGSSGPAIMFETTRGNASIVGVYADAVPHPVATSFAVEVYRILPNDTDFSPFRDAGRFAGLNSAYIDGSAVYHSPYDRPAAMDRGSLQQHGDNALALARAFGQQDIATLSRPAAYDATYFPVLGMLVTYPGYLVWVFAGLALLAVVAAAMLARHRDLTTWPRLAAGFGLALAPLLLAAALAQALWALLVVLRPGYSGMIDPWRPGWYRLAVVALVATVLLTWYGLLRRRFGSWTLALGGLSWLALLGLVLAALVPGGSYLAALPALGGALFALVGLAWPRLRLAAATLGGAVAVLILAPTVQLFFPALGLKTGGAAAFFAAMLGLALLPVFEWLYAGSRRLTRAAPAVLAGLVTIALVVTGFQVDRFDPAHPAPAQLMYAMDADTGEAHWISPDPDPGPWASGYVSGRPVDLSNWIPILHGELAIGPAAPAALPAPTLTTLADVTSGGQRTLVLSLQSQRAVRLTYLEVRGAKVASATVAGRAVPAQFIDDGKFALTFNAPPAEGIILTLVVSGTGPVQFRVLDGSDGLEGLPGFKPRPEDVGVRGSHTSELVVVAKTYTL